VPGLERAASVGGGSRLRPGLTMIVPTVVRLAPQLVPRARIGGCFMTTVLISALRSTQSGRGRVTGNHAAIEQRRRRSNGDDEHEHEEATRSRHNSDDNAAPLVAGSSGVVMNSDHPPAAATAGARAR
jgi:hypothetical protein